MSLQIWLPLNGDLENKGCETLTITGNPKYIDGGKIGRNCYKSSNIITLVPQNKNKYEEMTVSFWVKSETVETSSTVWWKIFRINYSDNTYHTVYTADNGTGRYKWEYNPSNNIRCNTQIWHHLTFVLKENSIVSYLDGIKVETSTETFTLKTIKNFEIGGNVNVYLNDVRIYDECLSIEQISQISKGLIAHYPLKDAYIEKTTNRLSPVIPYNTNTSPPWDTTLNGNTLYCPSSGWHSGYNTGVTNPTIGYHAKWDLIDGNLVMVFKNKNSEVGQEGRWMGIFGNIPNAYNIIPAGTKYTISFEVKSDTLGMQTWGGVYYKKIADGGFNFYDGQYTYTTQKKDEWVKFSYTFTRSLDFDGNSGSQTFYFYAHRQEGILWIRNPQLEIKDHSTPYVLGLTTRNEDIEYDTSGYGNNGVAIGDISVSPITLKNINSYIIKSKNINDYKNIQDASYIKGDCVILAPSQLTINWWANIESFDYQNSGLLSLYPENSSYPTQLTEASVVQYDGAFYFYTIDNDVATLNTTNFIIKNEWHMYSLTYDGTSIKSYRDGVLIQSSPLTGNLRPFTRIFIGLSAIGGAYRKTSGSWSDFRVYVTALSKEDVVLLYKNGMKIDKNGNVYCNEFVEEIKKEIDISNKMTFEYINCGAVQQLTGNSFHTSKTSTDNNGTGKGFIPSAFTVGKSYKLSYSFKKTDGELYSMGGHNNVGNIVARYIDGIYVGIEYNNPTDNSVIINNENLHYQEIYFTVTSETGSIYIQPNRGFSTALCEVDIYDVVLEEVEDINDIKKDISVKHTGVLNGLQLIESSLYKKTFLGGTGIVTTNKIIEY